MTGYGNSNRPGGGSGPSGARPPQGGGRPDTGNSADRGRIEDLLRPPTEPVRYFSGNDKKAIETRLLGEEAEKVAKKLAEVPASQLRRFYAEVMALKRRAELAGASDEEIRAQLTLLRARQPTLGSGRAATRANSSPSLPATPPACRRARISCAASSRISRP